MRIWIVYTLYTDVHVSADVHVSNALQYEVGAW